MIKGDGGAIGLTEYEAALGRWVIAGPEITRILNDFENSAKNTSDDFKHHEQTPAVQKCFKTDVLKMSQFFSEDNPFLETLSDDLRPLDSHTLADPTVYKSVQTAHEIGNNQYHTFVEERLLGSVSLLKTNSSKQISIIYIQTTFTEA